MDYVTVEQMVKEAKENLHEFSVEDVKEKLNYCNVFSWFMAWSW